MKRATSFRRAAIAVTAGAVLLLAQIALAQSPQTAHPVAPLAPPPQPQTNPSTPPPPTTSPSTPNPGGTTSGTVNPGPGPGAAGK
jgi:hypothetical protein